MVESKAKLKNLRISSKKVRLVADAIRGLDVVSALAKLPITFLRSHLQLLKNFLNQL